MKRFLALTLVFLSYLILTGCMLNRPQPILKQNLTQEFWMREVDSNPNKWARGASPWFFTGDPATLKLNNSINQSGIPMGSLNVGVPDFSKIKVNGDFQVQIFGTYGKNSVHVYGSNDAVSSTIIRVQGDTLCLNQAKKVPPAMGQVIVRIGVNRLNSIVQMGRGRVEGIHLRTNNLSVFSSGRGHVYLAGSMNLKSLVNVGGGCVTVFGANTPELDIKTGGSGVTSVSGNVGVRSIVHHGRTDINIVGANTNHLKILADGQGKIGINGIANLCEVKARDGVRVYVYKVISPNLYVFAYDKAHIGLAGSTQNIYIDAFKNSCVGARGLCAGNAYVRAHNYAHVNIAAGNKIFAASTEHSSVYFFGSPNIMSQFVNGEGSIIPIWNSYSNSCPIVKTTPLPYSYKGEYKGERSFPYTRSKRLKGEG